tara:strand:+ start:302 stop:649 length:348 start_codon:yes stop_codon:yes gene_type:complete
MEQNLNNQIKKNIVKELNQDLYKYFNMDLYDADHYFGYYNGYIYKLIDRVYTKYGSKALRSEIKYITQYLSFLFNKLERNSTFPDYILVVFYFRIFYRHYSYRKRAYENQLSFNF